jgi:hydroxyacylglutathione hydrolase
MTLSAQQEAPFRDLKIDDIKKLMSEGYEVVDVREDWEWQRGHIPGARHVVLASILANPGRLQFSERTIFACEVGERSAVASEMAVALGVKDVVNFRGGTKAWREAGEPLEKP